MKILCTRRQALAAGSAWLAGLATHGWAAPVTTLFQLATFSADVTPPLGHPLGLGTVAAQQIGDPLAARGFVLLGEGKPIVLAVVDWYEIRNDAHDRWRAALAEAGRTEPELVLVASLHQPDAPSADLAAQRILDEYKTAASICDLKFHERAVENVARAVRSSLLNARRITHLGIGQAPVEKPASAYHAAASDTSAAFRRTSSNRASKDPGEDGDPWFKTLSFWSREFPVAFVNSYAGSFPSSGKGNVSTGCIGVARKRRQAESPEIAQIYLPGCLGNIAIQHADSSLDGPTAWADRLYRAMTLAARNTRRHPITKVSYRTVPLRLEPRNTPGYSGEDLRRRLASPANPQEQCLAALGLSWRERIEANRKLDLAVLDFGIAQLLLLPGEPCLDYQLVAQRLRPESFVIVAGQGDCGPGLIPTARNWQKGDVNLLDGCWVAPGSDRALGDALGVALAQLPAKK